jgi:outer membrane putative beta-barrel porin/alpha-amylase
VKFLSVRGNCLRKTVVLILLFHVVTAAWGQKTGPESPSNDPYYHDWKAELYEDGIQDNSFLIEESYNQDYGVVQHINNFERLWQSKTWVYSFTQEWPVDIAPKNQLSYTVVATHSGDFPGSGTGLGDIALNYRYQLAGSGDARVAVAPRLSLLVPSGDPKFGRGAGGVGVQTNWAMSVVLNKKFTTHFNAGATITPHSKDESGNSATTYAYNLGHSLVWTLHPRFNAFVETTFTRGESVIGPRQTQWASDVFLNPGIRWAYNFASGLQIVPGISVPVGVGPTSGEKGIFFYLSFEHPYRRIPRKEK